VLYRYCKMPGVTAPRLVRTPLDWERSGLHTF